MKPPLMRAEDPRYVFVTIAKGLWLRTSRAVGFVACGGCGAPVGEPCRSAHGLPMAATHVPRSRAMRALDRQMQKLGSRSSP